MHARAILLVVSTVSCLVACTSSSGELLEKLSGLELQPTQPAGGSASLSDLMRCGAEMSPEVVRSEWDQLAGRADVDEALSSFDPQWSVIASAGGSLVNPSGGARLTNNVSWRIFDYFKKQQAEARKAVIVEALAAGPRFARKQAALLMLRSADELLGLRDAAAGYGMEVQLLLLRSELARMQTESGGAASGDLETTELALERAELRLASANASVDGAQAVLRGRCGWSTEVKIADVQFRAPDADLPESFSALVEAVLEQSETLSAASSKVTYLRELAELKDLERWTDVSISLDFSALFSDLRDLPTAPVSWALDVLDQGRFERELLRARADALLASLELEDARVQQIALAAEVLLSILDGKRELLDAGAAQRMKRLDVLVSQQQVSMGLASNLELAEAELLHYRASALSSAAERRLAISVFQYELLINPSAEVALNKLLMLSMSPAPGGRT